MVVVHPADGALHAWADIADNGWDILLVGNGLSINISPKFAYVSLYGEAEKSAGKGGLSDRDRAIFERFDTSNSRLSSASCATRLLWQMSWNGTRGRIGAGLEASSPPWARRSGVSI